MDLYALIYMKDEEEENGINMDNVKKAEDAAIAALGKDKPVSDSDKPASPDNTAETDTAEDAPTPTPMNMNSIYLVIGAVALIGIGAVAFILTKKKSGKKQNIAYEPDDTEEDEPEIVETDDEDEMNFYDHEDDEE